MLQRKGIICAELRRVKEIYFDIQRVRIGLTRVNDVTKIEFLCLNKLILKTLLIVTPFVNILTVTVGTELEEFD